MATTNEKLIFSVVVEDSKALSELKKLQAQAQTLKEEQQRLNKEYKAGNITLEQYSASTAELKLEQKAVSAEIRKTQKAVTTATGSLAEQQQLLTKLQNQYQKFSVGIHGTQGEYDALQKEIAQLNKEVLNQEKSIGRAQRDVGNYRSALDGLGGSFSNISNLLTGAGAVAFGAELLQQGAQAAIEYTKELSKIRKEAALLTGEFGDGLDRIVAGNQALASASESLDFSEVLEFNNKAANIFNETQGKSIELSQKLFATQSDGGAQAIATFESVANRANDAGISLEGVFSLIQSEQGLVGEAGKGVEAVAEAIVSLRERTPATREAITALGLDANDVFKLFEKDGFAAIQLISKQLGTFKDTAPEVGLALADIFKGPGEDAGVNYLRTIGDINLSLDSAVEKTGIFAQTQLELTQTTEALNLEVNRSIGGFDNVSSRIEIFGKRILLDAIKSLRAFFEEFSAVGDAAKVVGGFLSSIGDIVTRVGQRFGFFKEKVDDTSLGFKILSAPLRVFTLGIRGLLKVVDFAVRRIDDLRVGALNTFNAIKKASNDFLGTDFEQTEVKRLIGVKEEVSVDANTEDPQRSSITSSNRELSRGKGGGTSGLSSRGIGDGVNNTDSLKDAKARIDAELLVIEDGTKKALELTKKGLELEKQLKLSNDKLTTGERLLIETEYKQKLDALDSQFRSEQLAKGGPLQLDQLTKDLETEQTLMTQRLDALNELKDQEAIKFQETEEFKQQLIQQTAEAEAEKRQNRKDDLAEGLTSVLEDASFIISSFDEAADNISDIRLSKLEAQKERELALVGNSESKKASVEARFAKQKEALERRQAIRKKISSIAQAAIATALSIVETAKLGYPQAIPFQIIAGIIGATQIAAIAAQKFATGGISPSGGVPNGPLHAQNGIGLYNNNTGQYLGEMEGGEPILSRATYANNRGVVDQLLYNSMHKGGASIMKYGGISPIVPKLSYLQTGGTVPSGFTQSAQIRAESVELASVIANMPPPIVDVRDIVRSIEQKASIEQRAIL